MTPARRAFMARTASACALASWPFVAARTAFAAAERTLFNPRPNDWRTFDVTTTVTVRQPQGATQLWLPLSSIQTDWQQSVDLRVDTNGDVFPAQDPQYGARLLAAVFTADETTPTLTVTERVKMKNRAVDWANPNGAQLSPQEHAFWTAPTVLLPVDGIVRDTALRATGGASTDVAKTRAIFDWVVANAFRDQGVKGCGPGDIRGMLESGNLGGKCADINALFVGLCRAVGVAARDVYGLRLAPSAFGYKQLGGQSQNLSGAQHCRAEVFLPRFGWVAMDPADVTKVMRAETDEWLRTADSAVVAPVNRALFGGWEGNWMGYNMAHDLMLPGGTGKPVGFLMYPMGVTGGQPIDHYAAKDFAYTISAVEV
jgi:transglutaminase-like putative cysteine protease